MIQVVNQNIETYIDNLHALAMEGTLKARSDEYGWFVSKKFVLPFYIDKKLIFRKLVFSTGCLNRSQDSTIEDEKVFLDEVVEYCKKNIDADFISKAQSVAVFNAYPSDCDYVPWGTMIVDINKNEEQILQSFESNCRKKVRKAIKLGVEIEVIDDIELVYNIMKEMFLRQNSPYMAPLEFFQNIYTGLKNNIRLYAAKSDGEVQGVYIVAYDKEAAYSWYSASVSKPTNGSINYLQYFTMVDMMKMGIKEYNMVGARLNVKPDTKYAAINRFKMGFKPEMIEGYAFRTVLNPLKYALYNLTIKAYFLLKGMKYVDPIDQIKYNRY